MFILQLSDAVDKQRRVYFHLVDSTDGTTPKTGQTGKAWISRNGGVPVQTTNSLVEIDATNLPGLYYVQLMVNEISEPGWIQVRYKAATTLEFQEIGQLVAYDPYNLVIGQNASPLFNGGAPDIDYKKIAKMINDAVGGIKFPAQDKISLKPIETLVRDVQKAIAGISIPEATETDLRPVLSALEAITRQVGAIKMPNIDFSPLETLITNLGEAFDRFATQAGTHDGAQEEEFKKYIEQAKTVMTDLNEKIKNLNLVINLVNPPKPVPVPPRRDPVEEANNVSA